MRAVALITAVSLFGCYSTSPRTRTIAKITEGGMIVGGIVMEAFTKTGADCPMTMTGAPNAACHGRNDTLGTVGAALILGGLLGFVVVVSTSPTEKTPPKVDIKSSDAKKDEPKPKLSAPIAKPPAAAAVEANPAKPDVAPAPDAEPAATH